MVPGRLLGAGIIVGYFRRRALWRNFLPGSFDVLGRNLRFRAVLVTISLNGQKE